MADNQIEKLKHIFTDGFGFGCTIEKLENSSSPPQFDLDLAILNHTKRHYEPDTLLIVYYTGHGAEEKDADGRRHLQLSA